MENRSNVLLPLGRAALGVLFFVSGLLKIGGFAGVAGYMASQGLPIANILLVGVIVLEVGGGLLLITGWQARWARPGPAPACGRCWAGGPCRSPSR